MDHTIRGGIGHRPIGCGAVEKVELGARGCEHIGHAPGAERGLDRVAEETGAAGEEDPLGLERGGIGGVGHLGESYFVGKSRERSPS